MNEVSRIIPRPTLYGEVAERLLGLIEQGTFREGDKIPSIRTLSRQFDVSVNTIKEAYGLLESQRFIEVRPQSGYYVRRKAPPLPQSLNLPTLQLNPQEISMCRIYGEITQGRKDHGPASLALAMPDSLLLPSKKLNQHFQTMWKTLGQNAIEYAVTPGLKLLREQIAQQSLESGLSLSPEDIIITSGCSEAVYLAILALCRAGDTIAVETPTYFNFLHLLLELGIKVLEIPSSPRDGLNLEILEWALETHTVKALLAIPNFNNPLGCRMSDERKKRLVQLLELRGIPLIEDDIYGELNFTGSRPTVCKAYDNTGNVLLCSSFSKTLAPGYRVGWIVPGRHYAKIDKLKSLTSVATATPTQMAIAKFLEEEGYARHLRGLRQVLADQSGAMAELIAKSFPDGTSVTRPSGGFVLWVELPGNQKTLKLYEKALQEGIVFSPGTIFSASGKFENCLRLNAGVWNPSVEKAVRRLGELARENEK